MGIFQAGLLVPVVRLVNLLPKPDEKSLSKPRRVVVSGFCVEPILQASVSALLLSDVVSPTEGRPERAARRPFHDRSSSSPNLVSKATGFSLLALRDGLLAGACPAAGRPRRIGAIASKTFSRASTPAFFAGDCWDLYETRSSRGFVTLGEIVCSGAWRERGESGSLTGMLYVNRDFVPRRPCTCRRISNTVGR